MDGLAFLKSLPLDDPMPMARHFGFRVLEFDYGKITAVATPEATHENPFQVVQGGFAATVLDIALGLVSISILSGDAESVATTDLSVRYLRAIRGGSASMMVAATTIHVGRKIVVAESKLLDASGQPCAVANSTSLIARRGRGRE